ncbi:putative 39S ribosomal protein L24 [Sarcoptes scabiei]|uniref:Large ribosomal subunit protein uL24m n=1 Tax=Sarcoptes scabiei TaxID=52283 RepID=A0A132A5U6_SARSC|nr:putative 39S ribosomal protein L24 [Sarcoptes scabiei]KPM06331.1 39S ribosomal protein L24, mitochondrial-like protein [Sarcoptes scabiei]UXI15955.1 protein prenyltransferase alpha subunit repeat-containing protein 1 [Sarcoptes scabiei]
MRLFSALFEKIPRKYHYSNYPERFIKQQTEFVEWKSPPYPNYQPRTIRYRRAAYYDIHRPWTSDFQNQNAPRAKHPKIFVQPIENFPVFVGDQVQILRGKDQGKKGVVSYVVQERNWVCVKNLNLQYNLTQRDKNYPGMLNADEKPLLFPRDVALLDPEDFEPTNIEWRLDENGDDVRVSLRTGRIIPMPSKAYETKDFKVRKAYKEHPKDTVSTEVLKVTFKPAIKTFEMDIMDQMRIKENRIPYPMYWY